jgi:Tfp pilus assembly protein PilN
MIQFNLLPDVKQDYLKAKRLKHSVIVISLLVAAASLFIFVMLALTVFAFQKVQIKGLNDSIATNSQKLKATKDLDKILTIQNQLKSLPDLHDQKPVTSRLFTYLAQLTPAQVTIGNVELDYSANTLNISGNADSLGTINKFVDTLKFTTYTDSSSGSNDAKKPFSSVVLASFSRTDKDATYQITLAFDPAIFDSSSTIVLTTPKIISTRSETEKPTDLFKALPEAQQ